MAVRRSLIILAVLSLLIIPALTFASVSRQVQSANPARSLQLTRVQRGDVVQTISAIGEIEPDEVARLSFTRSGPVTAVLVQEGDYVLAGDVLVQQDDRAERIAFEQARLDVAQAELNYQDLLDDPDERDIRVAEANVDRAWGAYQSIVDRVSPEDLEAARQRLRQAEEAYTLANEARRVAGGDPNDIALLDARIGQTSFDLEIARLELDLLETGDQDDRNAAYAIVQQRQAELEQLLAGPEQAELDQAQVRVDEAMMALDRAEDNLELLRITAPFDGFVSRLNVEVGEIIAPGRLTVEMTRVDPLKLTVEVDEIDIRQITPGMEAFVELDALDDVRLPASVTQIALVGQEEDGIISYDVDLSLAVDDPRVRVGMTAEAEMIVQQESDVLVIPNQYVRVDRRTNRAFVNIVLPDETVQEREIELGLQGQEFSEVVSGLNEGDRVAVDLEGERFSFFGG